MSDAHAFLRTILKQPDDPVAPLVFADWLDESGEDDKLMWASYIRARDALARADEFHSARAELREQVDFYARRVHHRVHVHAATFLPHVELLLRLLPAAQWTLDLGELDLPRAIIEFVPEFVARENRVVPLRLQSKRLWVAMADPGDRDIVDKLTFILNKEIVAFQASADQIREAIDRHYGPFDTETVTSISWDMPLFALHDTGPSSIAIYRVIVELFERRAEAVVVTPGTDRAQTRYRFNGRLVKSRSISLSAHRHLLDRLQELMPSSGQPTDAPVRSALITAPTVGGRIQLYNVDVEETSHSLPTITLTPLWDR